MKRRSCHTKRLGDQEYARPPLLAPADLVLVDDHLCTGRKVGNVGDRGKILEGPAPSGRGRSAQRSRFAPARMTERQLPDHVRVEDAQRR